jgi:hypothetical protein
MVVLYGYLPGTKKNLCRVAKKSAAHLYPALIAWSAWFPSLARWPRCISADKRLISWNGLFMSQTPKTIFMLTLFYCMDARCFVMRIRFTE